MARMKDVKKRDIILETSKYLFSQKGFFATSISDIVNECGLPVGTIYNYFENKEDIVRVIIEEGWQELIDDFKALITSQMTSADIIKIVLDEFLPRLLSDRELITILLSEVVEYTRLEEKIDTLTSLICSVIYRNTNVKKSDQVRIRAGLAIFFLGILQTMRLTYRTGLSISLKDVTGFIKDIIESTTGLVIDRDESRSTVP